MKHEVEMWREAIRQGFTLPAIPKTATLAEVASIVPRAVSEHLLRSGPIQDYLDAIPKGNGTCCPGSPIEQLVRYVATQAGEVDRSDPKVALGLAGQIMRPVFQFEREQLLVAAGQSDAITPAERQFLAYCLRLAEAVDLLWLAWYNKVVLPYQRLKPKAQEIYRQRAEDLLGGFDYTAFDYSVRDGFTGRQTWAEAFREEIRGISFQLGTLIYDDKMLQQASYGPAVRRYLRALLRAYNCREIDQLERRWAAVDRAWVKIPMDCPFVLVYGMENGYENPYCVSPELRLECRTDQYGALIEETQADTIAYVSNMGLGPEMIEQITGKLGRMDIAVFNRAISAGWCLSFRSAGQVVPNRQAIMAKLGGKMFLDIAMAELTIGFARERLAKHCTPGSARWLSPLISAEAALAHTVRHECGHPVGCSPRIDRALGPAKDLLEEAKASLIGVVAKVPLEDPALCCQEKVAILVARILRMMHRGMLDNQTYAAYVRENLAVATILFDTGVIKLTKRGLVVNEQIAGTGGWINQIDRFVWAVVEAYQNRDRQELQQMTEVYCNRERPDIAALIGWINR